MTFNELREKYNIFSYDGFDAKIEGGTLFLRFDFSMGDIFFAPRWEIPCKMSDAADPVIQNLAFALGMVELISYYKAACPPVIEVKAGALTDGQIAWFEDLIYNGLSEFLYRNGIDKTGHELVRIVSKGAPLPRITSVRDDLEGTLIPVGGGKDSAVTLELLRPTADKNAAFIINPRGASLSCVSAAGYDSRLIAPKRVLDKKIIELNALGYLNGHTPFSAMAAFSSVLSAYVNGKKYVALSNESSANESTVEGTSVNHQYSKTFAFEKAFCDYIEKYVPCNVRYFSLLRPYSEFQIAHAFSKSEKYYDIFKSCNVGSKTDIWCGTCPKCLFVYIMMAPFIDKTRLSQIFGRDLFADESLIPTMDKLIGEAPEKPFECVGSRAEAQAALCLAVERYGADTPLLQSFISRGLYDRYKAHKHDFEDYFDSENLVPESFAYTFDIMRNL